MALAALSPDTVAEIGRLVQETTLSHRAIARQTGVARSTVLKYRTNRGWTRPSAVSRPPAGPPLPGEGEADASPDDLPDLIAQCLRLLRRQLTALGRRRSGASLTQALRAVAETGRTLKELSRITAALGVPGGPAAERLDPDDLDDARFAALCDELASAFWLWRERGAGPFFPGPPDAAPGA